jgi:hypothetical protein
VANIASAAILLNFNFDFILSPLVLGDAARTPAAFLVDRIKLNCCCVGVSGRQVVIPVLLPQRMLEHLAGRAERDCINARHRVKVASGVALSVLRIASGAQHGVHDCARRIRTRQRQG